jgi:hypothetical protein
LKEAEGRHAALALAPVRGRFGCPRGTHRSRSRRSRAAPDPPGASRGLRHESFPRFLSFFVPPTKKLRLRFGRPGWEPQGCASRAKPSTSTIAVGWPPRGGLSSRRQSWRLPPGWSG